MCVYNYYELTHMCVVCIYVRMHACKYVHTDVYV